MLLGLARRFAGHVGVASNAVTSNAVSEILDGERRITTPMALRLWARERAAIPVDAVAEKRKTDTVKVLAWEEGAARPTFKQAEKIAAFFHIPFGFLFLPEPPVETLPIHDLRTRDGMPREGFSADVLDLLRDVMFKCYWYRDYLENHSAEPCPSLGSGLPMHRQRWWRKTSTQCLGPIRVSLPAERGQGQRMKDLVPVVLPDLHREDEIRSKANFCTKVPGRPFPAAHPLRGGSAGGRYIFKPF
jgi:hypothetical protein